MSYEEDPSWPYLKLDPERMIKEQAASPDPKSHGWVPDEEEGFVVAEIKTTKGDQVTLVTAQGKEVTVKKENMMQLNPGKFHLTEDMSNLTYLSEASVLHNLRSRYFNMLIYTYSGLFCVVINPYKRLPIYAESVVKMYMGKRRNEMPPHLYAAADEAYRNMLIDSENQSMLITGESGAGKTENTKKVIAYFATVGASQSAPKAGDKKEATLEEQIVQTNPVLEAFGNAKTVRNNNSSRFGKFIRSHFSKDGKLAGGDIEHYLLEKSRVIRQAPGERCYHVFYQITSGEVSGLKEMLKLTNELTYYHFVSQAELTIDGVNDKEECRLMEEAFDIMGFSQEEKDNLYKVTAGIMHMGEMKFKQRPREEQAEVDTKVDAENVATIWGVDTEEFLTAFLKPKVRVGTEWVNKGQNLEQVHWSVGAMAKGLYDRMFTWLIARCNKTLDAKDIPRALFIGVLDIAGFEIFDFNSFEQLWINFVNEKLQQFFNHHMFVLEQEEYKREGIQWTFIDFGLDLAGCIELIEKPLGIISVLDEQCIVPKATDLTFAQALNDQHLGKHPNFAKPKPPKGKQAEAHFAINHYAGTVRYNVLNWLEKNKDPLNDTVAALLKGSDNALLQACWANYTTQMEAAEQAKSGGGGGKKKGKSGAFQTVSMKYRESLNSLMHMLHQTHPHFIRCIIPNEKKASGVIDAALVLNQLTCNGVLEGIRICRKGFPNRMLYADFKYRYSILAADELQANKDDFKKASTAMLQRVVNDKVILEEDYRIGETKAFFKAGILGKLEEARDHALSTLLAGLQAQIRWFCAQIEAKRMKEQWEATIHIQRNIKVWNLARTWPWFVLYGAVQPLVKAGKIDEEIAKVEEKMKAVQEKLDTELAAKAEAEATINKLKDATEEEQKKLAEMEEQLSASAGKKGELESKIKDLESKASETDSRLSDLESNKSKMEDMVNREKRSKDDAEREINRAKDKAQHEIRQAREKLDQAARHMEELEAAARRKDTEVHHMKNRLTDEQAHVSRLQSMLKELERRYQRMQDELDTESGRRKELARRQQIICLHDAHNLHPDY